MNDSWLPINNKFTFFQNCNNSWTSLYVKCSFFFVYLSIHWNLSSFFKLFSLYFSFPIVVVLICQLCMHEYVFLMPRACALHSLCHFCLPPSILFMLINVEFIHMYNIRHNPNWWWWEDEFCNYFHILQLWVI